MTAECLQGNDQYRLYLGPDTTNTLVPKLIIRQALSDELRDNRAAQLEISTDASGHHSPG
jgi:hypothetical protein